MDVFLVGLILALVCLNAAGGVVEAPGKAGGGILTGKDKAQIAETLRIRKEFGEIVWPKFSTAVIPLVMITEEWEFLVGHPGPPTSWTKVEGDSFLGDAYYRRPVGNAAAFTVEVGDLWAGSLHALESMNREMERQVRERFEGREVNPVMLEMFLLTPGGHVAALLHEAFHAFQAMYFPRRFQKALSSYKAEQHYPFEDEAFKKAWNEEGLLLGEAYTRKEDGEVKNIIRKFLEMREKRRVLAGLGADLIAYEKNLEWLEGMGKYAEMRFAELAAGEAGNEKRAKDYTIVFNRARYDMRSRLRRLGEQSGDLRFYLSGFVLARLLDRLRPGWKEVMFSDQKISFEDLLRECVAGP